MSIQSRTYLLDRPDREALANPYLFVVGCQRSGTTMLQRMLDAHPSLAVAYDSLFLLRPLRGRAIGENPTLDDKLVHAAVSHPRFDRLGLPPASIERAATESETYADFIGALYDAYARMHGKPLSGEKSPGFCRRLDQLHGILPEAKLLHLIRDGRDVALSIRDWGKGAAKLALWEEHPIAVGALWWRRDVTLGCESGRRLDARIYREIRYEDLIARTEQTLREISAHLDLPYSAAMSSYHEGRVKNKAGLSAKAAWLPPTSGIRDWSTQMAEEDRELFEAIAGTQLQMLGYQRSVDRISERVRDLAQRCEDWWRDNVEERSR